MHAVVVGVVFGWVGSMPLAGPVGLLVLGRSLRGALGPALAVAAGGGLGESLYCGLAFWGVDSVLTAWPWLRGAMLAGCIAALLLAGIVLLLRRPPDLKGAEHQARHPVRWFLAGLLLAALNPGLLASWTAIAAFAHAHRLLQPGCQAFLLVPLGMVAGSLGWLTLVATAVTRLRARIRSSHLRVMMRALGTALLIAGVVTLVSRVLA